MSNKNIKRSLAPNQSGLQDMYDAQDRIDRNGDGTIDPQEVREQEIISSVNGADGSFNDILGGEAEVVKNKKLKRHQLDPDDDEFEKGRDLTRNTEADDVIVKMRDVRVAFKVGPVERVIINHLNLDIKRGLPRHLPTWRYFHGRNADSAHLFVS